MYVHALHTVHAVPDLRVAAGRLRDGVSPDFELRGEQTIVSSCCSLHCNHRFRKTQLSLAAVVLTVHLLSD